MCEGCAGVTVTLEREKVRIQVLLGGHLGDTDAGRDMKQVT